MTFPPVGGASTTELLELGLNVVEELLRRDIDLGPVPTDSTAWERMGQRFHREIQARASARESARSILADK